MKLAIWDMRQATALYYGELSVTVKTDCLPDLNKHLFNWRCCRRIIKEMSRPPKHEDANAFLSPFFEPFNQGAFICSCVIVLEAAADNPRFHPKAGCTEIFIVNCDLLSSLLV